MSEELERETEQLLAPSVCVLQVSQLCFCSAASCRVMFAVRVMSAVSLLLEWMIAFEVMEQVERLSLLLEWCVKQSL